MVELMFLVDTEGL